MAAEAVLPERARGATGFPWLGDDTVRFAPAHARARARSRGCGGCLRSGRAPPCSTRTSAATTCRPRWPRSAGPDVKVLWHVHTFLGERRAMRMANRFKLGVVSRRVERILCVAPHLAEGVLARGAPAAKVSFFPNGLDTTVHVPPSAERRSGARDALGIAPDAVVALHFGRDWELKGGDVFLETMARLRAGPLPGPDRHVPPRRGARSGAGGRARAGRRTAHARRGCTTSATSTPRRTCCWPPAAARGCRSPCWRRWPAGCRWWPPTSPATTSRARSCPRWRSCRSIPMRSPPLWSRALDRDDRAAADARPRQAAPGSSARWAWRPGRGAWRTSTRAWPPR